MNNKYYTGYYSHSKRIYNTDVEKSEYNFLKSNFNGSIICPNLHLEKFVTMEPYLEFIKKLTSYSFLNMMAIWEGEVLKNVLLLSNDLFQFIYSLLKAIKWSSN